MHSKSAGEAGDNVITHYPPRGDMKNDKRLEKFVARIMKLDEDKCNIQADIKGVFDDASADGFDRKALKEIIKQQKKKLSRETRETVNSYLESLGQLPLFLIDENEVDEEEAA